MACDPLDFACQLEEGIGQVISAAANDSLRELANQSYEMFGYFMASLGTMWLLAPSPELEGGGVASPPPAAGTAELSTILGYVMWIALAVAAVSLIGFGVVLATQRRRGSSDGLGRLGSIGAGTLLIVGSGSIVAALLAGVAPSGSASAVQFIQNSLWFVTGSLAIVAVIAGGLKMAWEQRAQPGKELLQALFTLVAVAGAGVVVIGLGVTWADDFSVWVLSTSLQCDVTAEPIDGESTCFGTSMLAIVGLTMASPVGTIGVIVLACVAVLVALIQMALMIIRSAMLVLLAGILPASAAFTNTEMGRTWFKRIIGWTIAFILYKPAAAIIYAVAFQLVGSDVFRSDGGGAWDVLLGLAMMLAGIVALPALMAFAVPATSAIGGGGSGAAMAMGGAGVGAAAEVATGAVNRGSSQQQPAPYSSASSSSAPTGSRTSASSPAPGGAASSAGSTAGAGAGAASSAASAGGGAAATGAAAGGAGAAAAAGPAAPAVIGAQAVASGAKAVAATVQQSTESAAGGEQ